MKDNTEEWLTSFVNVPTHFYYELHTQLVDWHNIYSFTHYFKERFSTTQQKATWQKQLFDIKQGADIVDTYVNKFKQLKAQTFETSNW
jgi:hypothetical protein